jgi:hypothetical protein
MIQLRGGGFQSVKIRRRGGYLTARMGFRHPISPHCSAIFLQHSRSAEVIVAPGNAHAATCNAASISARAETPTLINSFNVHEHDSSDVRRSQEVAA